MRNFSGTSFLRSIRGLQSVVFSRYQGVRNFVTETVSGADSDFDLKLAERAARANAERAANAEQAEADNAARVVRRKASTAKTEVKPKMARVIRRNIHISLRKITPLMKQIRGLSYTEAIAQLSFSDKRVAHDVRKMVEYARSVAETKFQWRPERLLVEELYATKGKQTKKIEFKGRGKVGFRHARFVHLRVGLREIPGSTAIGKFHRKKFVYRMLRRQAQMQLPAGALPSAAGTVDEATIQLPA